MSTQSSQTPAVTTTVPAPKKRAKVIRNRNKMQIVSVLMNHKTNQFFITFNNHDAPLIGINRIVRNYSWLVKRLADIKAGRYVPKVNDSILHSLQYGVMWALRNSNISDWQEQRLTKQYRPNQMKKIEHKLAKKLERLGYVNVRSQFHKKIVIVGAPSSQSSIQMPSTWAAWNPVTTYDKFVRKLDSIAQAMNKTLTRKYKEECYFAANGAKPTVKDAKDLWSKFEKDGVFR